MHNNNLNKIQFNQQNTQQADLYCNQSYNQQYQYQPYGNGLDNPIMGGADYYAYNDQQDQKKKKHKKDKKDKKKKNHGEKSSSSSSSSDEEQGLGYFNQDEGNSSGISSNKLLRSGFVTKVYTILSAQMVLTVLLCAISMSSEGFKEFQLRNIWLFYLALVLSIIIILVLVCSRNQARKVPNNFILLAGFTFCESYMVSLICSLSNPRLVFLAAFFTMAIFFALTLYACTTKTDFTMMGGTLYMFSMGLLIFGIFLMFTDNDIMHLIYACVAAILCGFYILYDTQLIIGTKNYKYSIDDYIIAALELYLDIINLFLQILQILQRLSNSSD